MATGPRRPAGPAFEDHVRFAVSGEDGVLMRRQSGQVMVIVAVALLALIGSAALILLAGSVVWQKNQLQELADATAPHPALTIGIRFQSPKAKAVITEADTFLPPPKTPPPPLILTPRPAPHPH